MNCSAEDRDHSNNLSASLSEASCNPYHLSLQGKYHWYLWQEITDIFQNERRSLLSC